MRVAKESTNTAKSSAGPNSLVRGVPSYSKCLPVLGAPTCRRAFASFHPGGMNFLMADGSARFVQYGVGQAMVNAAATRAANDPALPP